MSGLEKSRRISTRKIRAGSTGVRHENCVAHESGVAYDMRHAGRGVTRRMHRQAMGSADCVTFAIGKQVVKLGAIALELVAGIKNFAKGFLNLGDMFADGDFTAQEVIQISGRGEMVGMLMVLDNPLDVQFLLFHVTDNYLRAMMATNNGWRRF